MRVFVYGSLLDPAALARRAGDATLPARMRPAVLRGWRRVGVKGSKYPTIVRHRPGVVAGAVVDLPAAAVGRLQAYEGEGYELVRVRPATERGRAPAFAWIAGAPTARKWEA